MTDKQCKEMERRRRARAMASRRKKNAKGKYSRSGASYTSFEKNKNLSHHTDHPRDCSICGAPMTSSDVNDYGTLCRSCYMKEYYGGDNSF